MYVDFFEVTIAEKGIKTNKDDCVLQSQKACLADVTQYFLHAL